MTFLIVLLWSIIGLVGGAVALSELGPLFGVRHMEGASAMFGLFTGAPVGLIAQRNFRILEGIGLRRG